jgi:hypothetical protein
LAHGPHYQADLDRVLHVAAADVAEMRRVGCVEAPAAVQIAPEPETPAPGSLAEFAATLPDSAVPLGVGLDPAPKPAPAKADAPFDPAAQAIMRDDERPHQ